MSRVDGADPEAIGRRYDEEAGLYPLLAAKVSRERYIAANLRDSVNGGVVIETMGDLKRVAS